MPKKKKLKCLWIGQWLKGLLLNVVDAWVTFLIFLLKITSWDGLVGSGLRHNSNKMPIYLFLLSRYYSRRNSYWHCEQQRKGTYHLQRVYSSTISHPASRLYMSRKNRGPEIDPCGTPGLIPFQEEFNSLLKHSRGFQIYHFGLISESVFQVKLCQRLLKCPEYSPCFEFTIEELIYFAYFVNDRKELIYTGVTRSKTWLIGWYKVIFKKLYNSLKKSLSKILLQIDSKETDWPFLMYCLSFFVDRNDTDFIAFHWKLHLTKTWLKNN